jgi:hypothetical protein
MQKVQACREMETQETEDHTTLTHKTQTNKSSEQYAVLGDTVAMFAGHPPPDPSNSK